MKSIIVIVAFILIVLNMGLALKKILTNRTEGNNVASSLSWRVFYSIAFFLIILIVPIPR